MQLFRIYPPAGRPITEYNSRGAAVRLLARRYHNAQVVCIALEAQGRLGWHPTTEDQLFIVISGDGEVCGSDGLFVSITAGTAAFWASGEMHETHAGPNGLVALVIEGVLDDPELAQT